MLAFAARAEEVHVASVPEGDAVILTDGRTVRLIGLLAPHGGEPMAEEARSTLAGLAVDMLALDPGEAPSDRYGRVLGYLRDRSGHLLQEEMLKRGLGRVQGFADNRRLLPILLTAEREAREARRGLWALARYRPRDPETIGRERDSFQVVEGTVTAAGRDRTGRIYLNFGADRRTDFTIMIEPAARRLFRADPLLLAERRLRVRGWVESRNGPMINATHPEQIELLDDPP